MEPYRTVRSEAELEAVAVDSLVCPAYFLGHLRKVSPEHVGRAGVPGHHHDRRGVGGHDRLLRNPRPGRGP